MNDSPVAGIEGLLPEASSNLKLTAVTRSHLVMKHQCGCILYGFIFALLGLPSMLSAQVSTGYLLQGYMETVPLSSPQLESVPEGHADSISTAAANPPAAHTSASPDPDLELNRVYQQLLNDHKDDYWFTTSLRQTQRAWLRYRDARADLESVIAGKTRPDGPTINRLTQARLEELKHVAIDGLPADFGPISSENGLRGQIGEGYNQFRQIIVNRKSAGLLPDWIVAQQTWDEYSDSERRFDSHTALPDWDLDLTPKGDTSDPNDLVSKKGPTDQQLEAKASTRLDQAHWADLQTLALELGLTSDKLPHSSEPVWDAQEDSETILSPRKDLRVEFSYTDKSQKAVVLSNIDNSQQRLVDPVELVGSLDKRYTAWSDVNISPDSHWIFQIGVESNVRDLYGDAILYQVLRTTPVELRHYFKGESFSRVAFRELKKLHGQESFQAINFADWKPDKLIFIITSNVGDNDDYWQCEYDLKKGTFSKPVKSEKPPHNKCLSTSNLQEEQFMAIDRYELTIYALLDFSGPWRFGVGNLPSVALYPSRHHHALCSSDLFGRQDCLSNRRVPYPRQVAASLKQIGRETRKPPRDNPFSDEVGIFEARINRVTLGRPSHLPPR